MAYSTYKVIHLFGIFLILVALGAASLHAMDSGAKNRNPQRKWIAITHGIGLLIVLVSGFGLLARLGISHTAGWPMWVWIKLGIWLVFGGTTVLVAKSPRYAKFFWFLIPILAALAAYLAINKPF
ncbi:MAG: SirB2 family protein [Candidatus Binatia bacterium]